LRWRFEFIIAVEFYIFQISYVPRTWMPCLYLLSQQVQDFNVNVRWIPANVQETLAVRFKTGNKIRVLKYFVLTASGLMVRIFDNLELMFLVSS
jgi:hypothetical protein